MRCLLFKGTPHPSATRRHLPLKGKAFLWSGVGRGDGVHLQSKWMPSGWGSRKRAWRVFGVRSGARRGPTQLAVAIAPNSVLPSPHRVRSSRSGEPRSICGKNFALQNSSGAGKSNIPQAVFYARSVLGGCGGLLSRSPPHRPPRSPRPYIRIAPLSADDTSLA